MNPGLDLNFTLLCGMPTRNECKTFPEEYFTSQAHRVLTDIMNRH